MKFSIYIILLSFWMVGCSLPKQVEDPALKVLPESFANDSNVVDTSSTLASLPWKQFFPDEELHRIIDTAIANNPDMQMALQSIQIASAHVLSARGAFLPNISLDANGSGTHYGKYTMDGVGNFDTNLSDNINDNQRVNTDFTPNYWFGFNTSWEVDVWGKLKGRKKAAQANYLASYEAKNAIQTALITQVATLYYTIKGLDQEYHVIQENLSLQQIALDNVQALMDGGRATQLAVQQFKAQLLNTENSATEVLRRRTEVENQLNALAGRFNAQVAMDTSANALQVFNSMDSLSVGFPLQILENRPDIREASLRLEGAKANVHAARQAFLPSLTISGYTALNAFKTGLFLNGSSVAYSLLGGVSAPLLQRKQLKSEFGIATAEQQNAFYSYQKNILNGYQEVATSFNNFEASKKMLVTKSQEAEALEAGVQNANDLYIGGYAGYLEIIQAQKSLIQAQVEEIQIKRDILLALVDMYKSVGGGWRNSALSN